MALEKRGNSWTARIKDASGQRVRVTLNTADEHEARVKYRDLLKALKDGKTIGTQQPNSTLADAWDRALLMHYRTRKSLRTVEFHQKAVYASIKPTTRLRDIGVDHYAALVRDQLAKGNSEVTMNRVFQTFGKVLSLAHGWHMMSAPAPAMPKYSEPEGRIRVYTRVEEQAIIAEFARRGDQRMADLTVFLVDTGFRLGEYLRRDRQQYHGGREAFEVWETKAGTGRTLPLTARANEAIQRLLAEPGLTKDSIESRWLTMKRNIGQAQDAQFVLHALRHTCCTRLWRSKEMNAAQIMRWMGHKDIKTTQRYTHLVDGDIAIGAKVLQESE
jgi:integrase